MKNHQRGSMLVGIIIGIVIGLAVALLVAVYVTKVPVPFMSKSTSRTAEQDAAETRKNQNWDPNAPLHGKSASRPAPAAAKPQQPANADKGSDDKAKPADKAAEKAPSVPAAAGTNVAKAPTKAPSADPLGDLAAAKAGGSEPFFYFVQAGAFRSPDEAEAQRAKLSLMGIEAKVIEREQAGRQLYRVRIGPFDKKDDADRQKEKLDAGGFDTALVRVQR